MLKYVSVSKKISLSVSTYLLSPLRAYSHIRPRPMNAIVLCPLSAWRPGPQLHPRAFISRSTDLLHVSLERPLLFPAGSSAWPLLHIHLHLHLQIMGICKATCQPFIDCPYHFPFVVNSLFKCISRGCGYHEFRQ